MNQSTTQDIPDFYDTANELESLLLKLQSIDGYKLVAQLRYAFEDMERDATAARRAAAEATNECTLLEQRIDDITDTYAAMQTGFRDLSDLRQVINA